MVASGKYCGRRVFGELTPRFSLDEILIDGGAGLVWGYRNTFMMEGRLVYPMQVLV
jgi:hypothetical protein